jgi:hypothetical protein
MALGKRKGGGSPHPHEMIHPQPDRAINPQDDNWGLRVNIEDLNSNKINTQDNSHALANVNERQLPEFNDAESCHTYRSTSQGRK